MASATCPSCGSDLESNAVLCIGCGFDLRTGTKLQTKVTSGGLGRKRLTDEERFAGKRFDVCQLRGVSTKILVSNENGDSVAYLFSLGRPLWTLFTVIVAVPLFFLVAGGLGFLFFALAERAIIPAPRTLLAILLPAAIAAGFLASLLTVSLMAPRRRLKVWADESRERPLMQVKETWKFGVARISVIDADGQLLGRIIQHRRRNQFVLTDHLDQPQAVLVSGKMSYSNESADSSLVITLLVFLALGLLAILIAITLRLVFFAFGLLAILIAITLLTFFAFGILAYLMLPKERNHTESFLYRVSSFEEKPTKGIGRITFNPARKDPYRIEFPDEADQSVDRRLVLALMGLMEW